MNNYIKLYLLGAACLLFGWGASTILHECFHLIVAMSLGLSASMEELTITTGSVFVTGDMTHVETTLVAIAGSLGLVIIGVLLVKGSNDIYRTMVGVIFLSRGWTDSLPLLDLDGAIMAESTGMLIAWTVVIVEVIICGGTILTAISDVKKTS